MNAAINFPLIKLILSIGSLTIIVTAMIVEVDISSVKVCSIMTIVDVDIKSVMFSSIMTFIDVISEFGSVSIIL